MVAGMTVLVSTGTAVSIIVGLRVSDMVLTVPSGAQFPIVKWSLAENQGVGTNTICDDAGHTVMQNLGTGEEMIVRTE